MPSTPSDTEAVRRYLNDIRHHIAMAEGFVAGIDYTTFKDDNLHLYAVVRCLEIISEGAAYGPPPEAHTAAAEGSAAAAGRRGNAQGTSKKL
jgi:hypothetical protein